MKTKQKLFVKLDCLIRELTNVNYFKTQKTKVMQNIPQGLIPYNHEKYLTGKYIAETRDGFRPDEVVYLKGSKQPVIYLDSYKDALHCSENGAYHYQGSPSTFDLFLRPKTVKKWHPVFKGMLCNSEHECIINWDDANNSLVKAVEVEVNED